MTNNLWIPTTRNVFIYIKKIKKNANRNLKIKHNAYTFNDYARSRSVYIYLDIIYHTK